MKRIFLGWDKPLLPSTADFLCKIHTDETGRLNLKNVSVVLPGSRACNRLEEILASRAATMKNKAWHPPEFLTPDFLPEKFYKRKKPTAEELIRCFAWMEAIRRLDDSDPELLKRLLPNVPQNFESRFALGKTLTRLHYELAADGLDFTHVKEACRQRNLVDEIDRWNALARLQKFYASDDPEEPGYLDELGLWDKQAARLYAIEKQEPGEREKIRAKLQREERIFYLVGLVDMNKLQKEILKNFETFIAALVFAPDEPVMRNRFDEFGCLKSEAWCDAPIEIDDRYIKIDLSTERRVDTIVLKPEHQADTVLRAVASIGNDYSSGQIVVGVPDKQVVPFLQQRFAQAGLPARLVEGTPLKQTGVYRFLEVLLNLLKTGFYRDYAELIRHPDVESFLRQEVDSGKHRDFIKLLDVCHKKRFPVFVPETWADDKFGTLQANWEWIRQLPGFSLQNFTAEQCSLAGWMESLKTILNRLYRNRRNDKRTQEALDIVTEKIESLQTLSKNIPERFSFTEALVVFLMELESAALPDLGQADAIEMIGWLEIAMDDAPVALITGMNEGVIPSSSSSDMFLPDELRKELKLMDNGRRTARDAYYLNVLLETRKQSGNVALIAGRRSTEGDPLLPSRFFFASNDARKVSHRVWKFFQELEPEIPVKLTSSLQPGCVGVHAFTVPELPPSPEPIEKVSVTAIKDYKACRYRFYLKHVLKLAKINDDATELGHDDFGTLIHEVLRRFGESDSPVRNSTSAGEIARFLDVKLDEFVREHYGESPMSTVEIQVERARERLRAFARWQAERRKFGYEIVDVELKLEAPPIMIAGIQLRGQIDRIDRKGNELVVLDYKTSDKSPEETHRKGKEEWIDFQLPLYHYILRRSGYAKPDDIIKLGYVTISQDIHDIREKTAEWDEATVQGGIAEAERLVTEMAALNWPAVYPEKPPPKYTEDFAFICQDNIS